MEDCGCQPGRRTIFVFGSSDVVSFELNCQKSRAAFDCGPPHLISRCLSALQYFSSSLTALSQYKALTPWEGHGGGAYYAMTYCFGKSRYNKLDIHFGMLFFCKSFEFSLIKRYTPDTKSKGT